MGEVSGDRVDMDTADRTAMHRLSALGQDFADMWKSQHSAISAGEAGIGSGTLAQAFLHGYQGVEARLKQEADAVPGICQNCADVGHRCADDYVAHDLAAKRGFDLH